MALLKREGGVWFACMLRILFARLYSQPTRTDDSPCLVFYSGNRCNGNMVGAYEGWGHSTCTQLGIPADSVDFSTNDKDNHLLVSNNDCENNANDFGGSRGCLTPTANIQQMGISSFRIR